MTGKRVRLGVNIDHVATLRQVRYREGGGDPEPCPVEAAVAAERAGADQITLHLREDRRHIQTRDLKAVRKAVRIPVNLEMAAVPAIVRIAVRVRPDRATLVPERRREVTTEGGLDAAADRGRIRRAVAALRRAGIAVSLFVDPEARQVAAAHRLGANAVELHTGRYAGSRGAARSRALRALRRAAREAARRGMRVFAGHGLREGTVEPVCRIAEVEELNIGHSLVAGALRAGWGGAVRSMRRRILGRRAR